MTDYICNWNKYSDGFFISFTDSDFAGCPDTSRSTSGNCITWMGAAISWNSNLQACVTLSTAEAELVAMTRAAQEAIWFRRLMADMGSKPEKPTLLYCGNTASLALLKNRQFHSRTKHIELRRNFTREQTEKGELTPTWITTVGNLADALTKPIKLPLLGSFFKALTGMELAFAS